MKFSATTNSFYDPSYTSRFPTDAVDVPEEEYRVLQDVFAKGGTIKADPRGFPEAVFPLPPTLQEVKSQYLSVISQICSSTILGGFTSSALGTPHTYPSALTDQANLVTHVMSSLLPNLPPTWTTPYICGDSNEGWAYRDHTAAQIQQVGADWKAFLSSCLLKKKALEEKVKAAKTIEKVQTIAW